MPACGVKAWSHFKHSCCSSSLDMSNTEDVHDKLSCSLLGPKMSSCLFVALNLGSVAFCLSFLYFYFWLVTNNLIIPFLISSGGTDVRPRKGTRQIILYIMTTHIYSECY